MRAGVELPKAFSVRDDGEFSLIRDLMTRLNPKLLVVPIAMGVHVNGGCTVNWGLVYLDGQPLTDKDVQTVLEEAGLDFHQQAKIHPPHSWVTNQGEVIEKLPS